MSERWPPDFEPPAEAAHEAFQTVECWRCGKQVSPSASCPHCAAPLSREPSLVTAEHGASGDEAVIKMIVFFGVLLVVTVVHGLSQHFNLRPTEEITRQAMESQLWRIGAAEAINTLVVIIALASIRLPRQLPRPALSVRLRTWGFAGPLLAVVLAGNFAYHWLLRQVVGLPLLESELARFPELLPWTVVLFCVQPAIVEELFFRYLALDTLRSALSMHGAVFVSSIMFGMAHIGTPLSIPILFALGLALGYVRIGSGGLLLPMLMHFVHNGVVIYLETIT